MPEGSTARSEERPAPIVLHDVHVVFTSRHDGDLAPLAVDPDTLAERRLAVVSRPWFWVRQVHGSRVVTVEGANQGTGEEADALVSRRADVALTVVTADCAPIALASSEGVFAAVHAGWRGLLAGVVENAVAAMRELGASEVEAAIGPCIRPSCYAFGSDDLAPLADRFGGVVRGRTSGGDPSLDLPAAVRAAIASAGARVAYEDGTCTACSPDHWSHRARSDQQRQAVVVWRA